MAGLLYWRAQAGLKIIIPNMTNKSGDGDNYKFKQIIELLKLALSLDDEEIIKSTVESVIEILEEEIAKWIVELRDGAVIFSPAYQ